MFQIISKSKKVGIKWNVFLCSERAKVRRLGGGTTLMGHWNEMNQLLFRKADVEKTIQWVTTDFNVVKKESV